VIVDDVVKPIAARQRPFEVVPEITLIDARPDSNSFPSGHAALAVAGALAGTRMMPMAGLALWPFVLLVALSRIYLGMHWPSDVAAGALIGLGTAWFVLGGRSQIGSEVH
jgi:undecaprenyl-diphosphatase